MQTDLEDITDLIEMREELSTLVINAMKEAEEYQESIERFSYLWTDDPQEFMRNFLFFGHVPTQEELDTRTDDMVPKAQPTLAQFQQQVRPALRPSGQSPSARCCCYSSPVDGLEMCPARRGQWA